MPGLPMGDLQELLARGQRPRGLLNSTRGDQDEHDRKFGNGNAQPVNADWPADQPAGSGRLDPRDYRG